MDYEKYFQENGLTTVEDFFRFMQSQFRYGWIDQDGNRHRGVNNAKTYALQAPCELLGSRLGICWDMTELYRCFFANMTPLRYETYYLFYDDNRGCPSHSILAFYDDRRVYWFEPMFTDAGCYYSGIHEYDSIKELLEDLINVFAKSAVQKKQIPADYNADRFYLYRYEQPKYHINGFEMREHINRSERVHCGRAGFPG